VPHELKRTAPREPAWTGEPIVDYPLVHEEASRRHRCRAAQGSADDHLARCPDCPDRPDCVQPARAGHPGADQHDRQRQPWYLLAAFVIYYLGFPLRGFRWQRLLLYAGTKISLRDSTEIIFISWLVNCLVPAKLGDVYRAWLLKANYVVSLSRTFGTVFIERIFDLFAIAILGLAAGFWSFRAGLRPEVQLVFAIGIVVLIILSIGLYSIRNFGRRFLVRIPMPRKDRFSSCTSASRRVSSRSGHVRSRCLPSLPVSSGPPRRCASTS
jgi:hypothetical protein